MYIQDIITSCISMFYAIGMKVIFLFATPAHRSKEFLYNLNY